LKLDLPVEDYGPMIFCTDETSGFSWFQKQMH